MITNILKAKAESRLLCFALHYYRILSFLLRSCLNVFQFSKTEVLPRISEGEGLVDLSLTLLRVDDIKWIEFSIFFHFEGCILLVCLIDLLLV